MALDDPHADGGAIDLEKKRGLNPWVIFGIVLFAVAFVFGWRSVASTKNDVAEDRDPESAGHPS
ncbi:MAG: hypothetical protein NVSMB19_16430 [Vulcanimicrobiaceae bacterium]